MSTEKSKVDMDLEQVTKNADRLKLRGTDREEYIHRHMRGYGYKSRRAYFAPEDEDERTGGGFFGGGRKRRRDDEDDEDDED